MLPSQALQNFNQNGHTHQGLVDDISTRSLQTVRVGEGAGKINTGIGNALVGYEAGKFQQDASFGTFVGYQAGYQNLSASYGTFVGAFAGAFNERGEENVFVGYRTGEQNTSGSECVGVGAYAMRYNASGNYSVSVGYAAGERCIDGSFNTMIGAQSGQDNRSGSYNTMAGYRSGRSAFQGNYNTYFGSYAGYSNYHGDANCFIGYRSGESLSEGNYNIAIGAYSLAFASQGDSNISIGPFAALFTTGSGNIYFGQNAGASNYSGDFNIIIGVDAGLSNVGNKNVIIGESSAPVWKGDCNVLIGAEVAKIGSGFQSVIIGYRAASTNYQAGNNNIFIGDGSDATRSNVDNAISIGTVNVITTADTIAIGKNIENTGINSVSLGFDIQTNAQNSVLVGETLTITSATYFNDPLNIEIVAVIQSDAYLKFGISNILYTNGVLGTLADPFATAEFGYQTSNTYATTTNPTKYRTSPSRYNLADAMGYYGLMSGCNLFYTTSSCNSSATFNQTLTELTASNIYIDGYSFALSNLVRPVISAASNGPLIAYASNQSKFYSSVVFGNLGIGTTFVLNVFSTNLYSNVYPLNILKKHLYPSLNDTTLVYPDASDGIYVTPSESNIIAIDPPRYGVLDTCLTALTLPSYTLTTPQLFASNDTMSLLASVYYYDINSNLIGISSNASGQSARSIPIIDNDVPTALTPRPFTALVSPSPPSTAPYFNSNQSFPLTSNEIVFAHRGQWGAASNLVFAGFDPAFVFYDNQTHTTYTCNQALHVPQFAPTTITYSVDVNTLTSTFEFAGSNDSFYIGNTYQFQQYALSNLSLQLRFASAADGAGGTDYTSNVTFTGTPGVDGVTTILITSNTPTPLYYYASNQIGYGGSNDILPIPTGPLTIPYASVLAGSNAFRWASSNGTSNYEPFRFTIATCNLQIPFISYQTTGSLWQDTAPLFSSNYTLTNPSTVFYGTSKSYSNIYVEQYPSYGRLRFPSPLPFSPSPVSNVASIGYQPLELWDERTDHVQFLLGNTADNTYKRFTWSLHTIPGSYQSSNYWIQTPTRSAFVSSNVALMFLSYSSNAIYDTTVYTSNIVPVTGPTVVLPPQTVYTPITSYDSTTIGQRFITSNETQQSNQTVFSGTFGSNQTVRINETSNIDISFTGTSNIQFTSNVLSVQNDGTYTDPYRILTVTYYQTNVTHHLHLYDSNYTVYRQWDDRSNVYDSTRNTYLFNYSNAYPIATSNLLSSNELPNGASALIYTYSNTDIQRVFREDRSFHPISRTSLYQSNAVFTTLASSYYHVIESNVGVVSGFHSSNIALNKLYLEPVTPTPLGAVNQRYDYTVTGGGGGATVSGSIVVPYLTSNASISTLTLTDYKNRTGDQWLVMDSNYQASLTTWETTIRPTLAFTPTHLYITDVQRGSIVQPSTGQFIHRLALGGGGGIAAMYQASGHYDTDRFEFFYANETTQQVSTVYLQTVFLRFSPTVAGLPLAYTVSSRPAHWNPFTSNAFFFTAPEQTYTNLYYRFNVKNPGDPLDFYQWPSKTTLSLGILGWSNLADASVYATVKNTIPVSLTSNTVTYTVYDSYMNASLGTNAIESGSYTFPVVPFYDYPQPTEMSGALESIRFLQRSHCNVLSGIASNLLVNYVNYEGDFQSNSLHFLQSRTMSGGFLSNAYFAESNISQNEISYYPFQPNVVSNEPLYVRWVYPSGITSVPSIPLIASPEYTLSYKNYWFLSGPQPITPQRTFDSTRLVSYDDRHRFILSDGFVTDRGSNSILVSPSNYTYPYHSNLRTSNVQAVTLTTPGVTLASTVTFVPVAYSYPPVLLTSSITLPVEQAGDVSLSTLVGSNALTWDSNNANDLYMYVDTAPVNGLLLNSNNSSNLSAWSYSELLQDHVRYQHLGGGGTALTDTFSVRFATHDYNVTTARLTVNVVVEPLPRLTDQRRDAIYTLSSNEALATHYPLNASLTFASPAYPASQGYIHVLSSSNIYTELAGAPCNVLPLAQMTTQTSNTYRFQPDYFVQPFNETGVTGIYDPLSFQFALRARSNASDVHRLTYEPMYSNLIVHDWHGELNQFVSSNTTIPPILSSNDQRIEYQLDVRSSNYPPLALQETSFSFYTQPNSSFLPMNSNALQLFDPYLDFAFRVEFQDSNAADIASFQISRSAVTVFSHVYPIPPTLKATIDFNSYTYWSFVFNDSANESALSLYINPNTSLPNKENQSYNLFKDVSLTPSLSNVATIRIVSDADHPKNYYPTLTSNIPSNDIYSHVSLTNYDHRLYFKNVELSTKYPTNQATDILTDTYNIALGKNIQIRGEDNICFGTNFSTLGKFSIIIGNNIGQSTNFVNQVYESIIIGNTSFQGSIIRNVIAIGSALMNDLYAGALPGLTDQVINQFISKKPILIGNNIGPEKVDYHVNIANTFMRTSVGNTNNLDQIYLGNDNEVVAIGYTSNSYLQGPADLFVNGDIQADAIQYHFSDSPVYGTSSAPVNGGTFIIDTDTNSRVIFELASNTSGSPAALNVQFSNFSRHIGKELDIVFNERSSVPRALTLGTNVRFAVPRPTQTTPAAIDRLQCWIIQSNVAIGTYTSNAARY